MPYRSDKDIRRATGYADHSMMYDEHGHAMWLDSLRAEAQTSLKSLLPRPKHDPENAFTDLFSNTMLAWEYGKIDDIFAEGLRHGLKLNHSEALHLIILANDNLLPQEPRHFNWRGIRKYITGLRPEAAHKPLREAPFTLRDVGTQAFRSSMEL